MHISANSDGRQAKEREREREWRKDIDQLTNIRLEGTSSSLLFKYFLKRKSGNLIVWFATICVIPTKPFVSLLLSGLHCCSATLFFFLLLSISSNFPVNENYALQNVTGNFVYFSVFFVNSKGIIPFVLALSKTTVFEENC